MIKSFSNELTEKIFLGEKLTKKERKQVGGLDLDKAQRVLKALNMSDEKRLLSSPSLSYHKLHGTTRYSIDANGRKNKWRITFGWENEAMQDVKLVEIEDTH